jgi:SAM-dependent methyltransferase
MVAPTNPRTAVVWAALRRELERRERERRDTGDAPLTVLDVGGGTGGFAVPLAQAGHDVTVIDASPDALAALIRRATDAGVAGRVHARQGDADSIGDLVEPDSVDLVLCHSVLEVVDDPGAVIASIARTLRPAAAVSLLVANRAAAVLAKAVGGQFAAADALLHEMRAGERDPLRRRFDVVEAAALLTAAGITVEEVHGVRVVADLVAGQLADSDPAGLLALELAMADLPPYRDIATQLHVFGRGAR